MELTTPLNVQFLLYCHLNIPLYFLIIVLQNAGVGRGGSGKGEHSKAFIAEVANHTHLSCRFPSRNLVLRPLISRHSSQIGNPVLFLFTNQFFPFNIKHLFCHIFVSKLTARTWFLINMSKGHSVLKTEKYGLTSMVASQHAAFNNPKNSCQGALTLALSRLGVNVMTSQKCICLCTIIKIWFSFIIQYTLYRDHYITNREA